jgi:hypothetical protein
VGRLPTFFSRLASGVRALLAAGVAPLDATLVSARWKTSQMWCGEKKELSDSSQLSQVWFVWQTKL